jgi:Protein of unknown function (DUF4238)
MPGPKLHHYVPQMYLRRFADDAERLITVDLATNSRFPQSVGDAAAQNYFYAVDNDEGGRSMAVEQALSELESAAAANIDRLLAGDFPPAADTREAIAAFLGLQWTRTPRARDGTDRITDSGARLLTHAQGPAGFAEALRRAGEDVTDEEAAELWQELVSGTAFRVTATQDTHIRLMLEAGDAVATLFANLPWQLVRFERRGLLTCDHPIGLWHHDEKRRRFGIGPATAEEIWVPLERRTALLVSTQWDDGELLAPSARLARRINQIVVVGARRWLYHDPADAPTQGIALPRRTEA